MNNISLLLSHFFDTGKGREGEEPDFVKAFECFQKSAMLGNSNGQLALGNCYNEGIGTEQISFEKALEFWQKGFFLILISSLN